MLTKRGYGGKNANIWAEEWSSYSSTNSHQVVALFRISNPTAAAITWSPQVIVLSSTLRVVTVDDSSRFLCVFAVVLLQLWWLG